MPRQIDTCRDNVLTRSRLLGMTGLLLGMLTAAGCFSGSLLQSGSESLPTPASRIAPWGLAPSAEPAADRRSAGPSSPVAKPENGLLPAPLPQDLPPIPISRE